MVTVLFICTGNAARSQMAEGLLKNMNSSLNVLSAGTKPEGLNPKATIAMEKIGIDISNQVSKNIQNLEWQKADFAITLCGSANESCVSMAWPKLVLNFIGRLKTQFLKKILSLPGMKYKLSSKYF